MSKFRCCNCGKMKELQEVKNCSYCGSLMCRECASTLDGCPRCDGYIDN